MIKKTRIIWIIYGMGNIWNITGLYRMYLYVGKIGEKRDR